MDNQQPDSGQTTPPQPESPFNEDPREKMRRERHEFRDKMRGERDQWRSEFRDEHRTRNNWVMGIFLILVGGLLLLQNFTGFYINNWWALFLLIPASGSFLTAWTHYEQDGRITSRVRNSLLGGIIFLIAAAIFLLNLNLSNWWPVFLILGGVLLVINTLLPE